MELESYESLNKDPDYKLEIFWYSYKCFFSNFYSKYITFKRETDSWSHTLNILKGLKQYSSIQEKIYYFLKIQTCDVIISKNTYHISLLKTNINRYMNLCKEIKFYNFDKELIILDNIVRIYYLILNQDNKFSDNKIFDDINLIVFDCDYESLFDYALNNKKGSIIDRLRNITDIKSYLKKKFNIDIDYNMKGNKIINLYNRQII